MKIAESWLREWVNPEIDSEALAHHLTMLGHEVDGVDVEGEGLEKVIVAEVVEFEKHPDADRLNVCKVSTGNGELLDVVCGAPNVSQGMKSPLALPGTRLPDGIKLRKSKIRGVVSNGMLCSAVELGLGDESDGIISLPDDAKIGQSFAEYLSLPDTVIDLDLTPNRGDCFSTLGIARDVAALTGADLASSKAEPVPATIKDVHPVEVANPAECPSFGGRVIRNIDPKAVTPAWMVERLRRVGLRPIHPIVDVTNYIMMDLGQPCHAYDLDKLQGAIRPRLANAGEKVVLLDEKEVEVSDDTLVISDDSGAIGLAGIMGGLSTAVSDSSTNIFFEAAFWPQDCMAGRARSYGLHTDASMRFERGVDPHGQMNAIEKATALILEICGGEAGPNVHTAEPDLIPQRPAVLLRRSRLALLLGAEIADDRVNDILVGLGMQVEATDEGWMATPPSHRFDINIEADLIEEIARIFGYDNVPEATATAQMPLAMSTESTIDPELVASALVGRDFQEVITYSFIDSDLDALFTGVDSKLALSNPISSEMSVMRASLLPGMVAAAASNIARQQDRVRLFEIGKSFHGELDSPQETERLAMLVAGPDSPEQWGEKSRNTDFFDIKSDLEAVLSLTGLVASFSFEAIEHPALQPGQAAQVCRDGSPIGYIGKLHPTLAKRMDIKTSVFVVELDATSAFASAAPAAKTISRYPSIRRDIAVLVNDDVNVADLVETVISVAPDTIQSVRIFDIYRGPGVEAGLKSVALGLILQETSRTLTDDDADSAMTQAVQQLQQKHAAELRE